ncbi:MAG: metallophosphoesterase [Bacteroidota bacterium]|nr:metallophosphoesterase [Bacteroidota bacterium]MDP4236238.1 metallophosphoesterase [Bacteroidota bacterium]
MRKGQVIIFFSVFLSIYGLVNYYIFIRGFQGLEYHSEWRLSYALIFLFVATSYFVGRFLEKRYLSVLSDVFMWIGSFWFAFILYFLLSVIAIDIARLLNIAFGFLPVAGSQEWASLKFFVFVATVILTFLIVFVAYLNAKNIRVKRLDLAINKSNAFASELTIAVASDIHLGTIINRRGTKRIVEILNSLNADIVLLPGDIVDGDVEPVIKQNLGEVLRTIKSKYGIFGITGNHEYIGGVEPAVKYISDHGIRVLRDERIEVAGLTIIGREDRSATGFAGKKRKSIEELAEGVDRAKPIILMDHQPFKLDEAVSIGTDLQLSGHTHHGQLWPLNFITNKVYELSWGYLKKGNTHIYVSCGAGSWGPPTRLGNTPEIMLIRLRFTA